MRKLCEAWLNRREDVMLEAIDAGILGFPDHNAKFPESWVPPAAASASPEGPTPAKLLDIIREAAKQACPGAVELPAEQRQAAAAALLQPFQPDGTHFGTDAVCLGALLSEYLQRRDMLTGVRRVVGARGGSRRCSDDEDAEEDGSNEEEEEEEEDMQGGSTRVVFDLNCQYEPVVGRALDAVLVRAHCDPILRNVALIRIAVAGDGPVHGPSHHGASR